MRNKNLKKKNHTSAQLFLNSLVHFLNLLYFYLYFFKIHVIFISSHQMTFDDLSMWLIEVTSDLKKFNAVIRKPSIFPNNEVANLRLLSCDWAAALQTLQSKQGNTKFSHTLPGHTGLQLVHQ